MQATGFDTWVDKRIDLFGLTALDHFGTQPLKVSCLPNPAHEQVKFQFFLLEPSNVLIRIMNSAGQTVHMVQAGNLGYLRHTPSGLKPYTVYSFVWDVNLLANLTRY